MTALRPLGATGVPVSAITLGGSPLGSMPETFGYEVGESDAIALVRAVLDSGIRTIDTANGYSNGRSEERIGRAIDEVGGLPADAVVITKVDAQGGDYSGDRIRRSLDESRERLGIDPLPVVHLHDPEFHDFGELTAPGGAVDALVTARESGEIGHLGLAGGDVRQMRRYLDLGVFEVLLVHNRWTLVDRSAEQLLAQASAAGMGIVNAAVLGGGILTGTRRTGDRYGYRTAPAEVLAAIDAMHEVCRRHATDLGTAAIRFSTRDPRVHTTVIGLSKTERIAPTLAAAEADLPEELWAELEALLPAPEHWLDAPAR
ncbi:MAG: aldo/keto reductase [Micrococcales bacterium]|nr:aldo/keto reductase [Micrococcales bacterium]